MQFYLTAKGRQALINQEKLGLDVELKTLVLGTQKYDASTDAEDMTALKDKVAEGEIAGGIIVKSANELRLNSMITGRSPADIYEIGIVTSKGVLFAVASEQTGAPIARMSTSVTTVVVIAIQVVNLTNKNITIQNDPNSPIAVALMADHIQASNPHPQYMQRIIKIEADIEELRNRVNQDILVNDIFLTKTTFANSEEVRDHKRYGRWQKLSGGRALVTHGDTGQPEWTRNIGNEFGEYTHQLTKEELPHIELNAKYRPPLTWVGASGLNGGMAMDYHDEISNMSFGSDQPHNIVQWSVIVGAWVRLPDVDATYSLTANVEQVRENQKFKIMLNTTELPKGTNIGWRLSGLDENVFSPSSGVLQIDKQGYAEQEIIISSFNSQPLVKDITFALTNGKALINIPKIMPESITTTIHLSTDLLITSPVADDGNIINVSKSVNLYELFVKSQKRTPLSNELAYFIVHDNVAIVGTDTLTPAIDVGTSWLDNQQVTIDNYGFVLGRGGDSDKYRKPLTDIKNQDGGTALKNSTSLNVKVINRNWLAGGGGAGGYEITGASGAGAPLGVPEATIVNAKEASAGFRNGGAQYKNSKGYYNGAGGGWGESGQDGSNSSQTDGAKHKAMLAGVVFDGKFTVTENSGIIKGRDQS